MMSGIDGISANAAGNGAQAGGSGSTGAEADALIAATQRTLGSATYTDTIDLVKAVHARQSPELEIAVQARLTPVECGDFARALDRVEVPSGAPGQIMGANGDFLRNYDAMRASNTIGADKYFHCKANFEAAQRGPWGAGRAAVISDVREWVDQPIKGDPASASQADQQANHWGRMMGGYHPTMMAREGCDSFRPNGLDARY